MATKSATKKPAARKTATKTTTKKTSAKKATLPVSLVRESYPEAHVATGKYKFFFAFFAITTLLFAAICVWLFVFSSEVLDKWESLKTCARNDTCEIEYVEKQENAGDTEDDALEVVEDETEDVTTEE